MIPDNDDSMIMMPNNSDNMKMMIKTKQTVVLFAGVLCMFSLLLK